MKRIFFILGISIAATALKAESKPIFNMRFENNDSTILKQYCGNYAMKGNPYIDEVTISFKDGKLFSISPDSEEIILEHTQDDEFYIPSFNAKAFFIRQNGTVTGIKVRVNGNEFTGDRKAEK